MKGFINHQNVLGGLLVGLSIVSVALIIPSFHSDTPVSADQIEGSIYSLSATTDDNIDIKVLETDNVVVGSHDITVSTDCPAGYNLSIHTDDDKIYKDADPNSEYYLSPATGTIENQSELENNQWGFSILDPTTNDNKFSALPLTQTEIKTTDSSTTEEGDKTPIYYGVKTDGQLPSGDYIGNITYTITPNSGCLAYLLNFSSPDANPTSFPSRNITYSDTIDLSAYTPTKDGYAFSGWDNGTTTLNGIVSATELNPEARAELTLTAKWTLIQVWNFDYTGAPQTFTVPVDGTYKIEAWGASGRDVYESDKVTVARSGGKGAYTAGNINLAKGQNIFVYAGEQGISASLDRAYGALSFNGGSGGNYTCWYYYGTYHDSAANDYGGGATDVRLVGGNWNDFNSLKSRIIVSAGGAAVGHYPGAAGGGLSGYGSEDGNGGTQTSSAGPVYGGFGYAGTPVYNYNTCNYSAFWGAGSGYYGGGASNRTYYNGYAGIYGGSAGSGSSFISGHNGCNAVAENSTSSNIIHTGQPNHYSGYKFTNTKMIDGAGYAWTNVKGAQEQMPNPAGGYYALGTGHTGHGYVRITLIDQ